MMRVLLRTFGGGPARRQETTALGPRFLLGLFMAVGFVHG